MEDSPDMTITHVLGARPNFMKAAPVIRALAALGHEQRIVHTGQHYDERMSEIFFVQLGLSRPDVNLGVGSGSHASQTAEVLTGMEREFIANPPALTVVYGDVNSTLGAALAATKLGIALAHVEAGLRSFDDTMPEEINRRLTDQLCGMLFTTSPEAVGHLAREGRPVDSVYFVGNPMIDTLLANMARFDTEAARAAAGLPERYVVVTLHRPANVDDPGRAAAFVRALHEVAQEVDVVIPVHPRGRAALEAAGLSGHPRLHPVPPLGYLEFVSLVRGASAVITDSGGVQEETTLLRVPCLTLRPNTERPITITSGSNRLVVLDQLAAAVLKACADGPYSGELPPLWDGKAGQRIGRIITASIGLCLTAAFVPQPRRIAAPPDGAAGSAPGQHRHREEDRHPGRKPRVRLDDRREIGPARPAARVGCARGALDLADRHHRTHPAVQQVTAGARGMNDGPGLRDYRPFGRLKGQRGGQVVADDRRQAGQPVIALFAHAEDTAAEQARPYLRQPGPHVVVPADQPRPAGQLHREFWCRGEDAWLAQRFDQ